MRKPLFLLGGLCLLVGTVIYAYRILPRRPQKIPAYLAGHYHWGNPDYGASLDLEANGTYTSLTHSDVRVNDPEDRKDTGRFTVEGDKVILISADWKPYYSVPWGKRTYLLVDDQFGKFVDAIRSGKEPCNPIRDNDFMVRGKDSDGTPKGLPQFPKEWRHLLNGVKRTKVLR